MHRSKTAAYWFIALALLALGIGAGSAVAQMTTAGDIRQAREAQEVYMPAMFLPAEVERLSGSGVVAGELPGYRVYDNVIDPVDTIRTPGAGEMMAEDMSLACGACSVVYYELGVAGLSSVGGPETFDVEVALWNGDPCLPNSSVIPGTQQLITGIPNDNLPKIVGVTLAAPIPVGGSVYMSATFSTNSSGWLVARRAELGFTRDIWVEDDSTQGCAEYFFPSGAYAGFWGAIHCDLPNPLGACCNGSNCTQTTESNCTAGVWQGACTPCVPNICQLGTCCEGLFFNQCTETTEAGCVDGAFSPGDTCVEGCRPNFKVFENDFRTGEFAGIDHGRKYADDLEFGPGTPCEMLAFDVIVFGDPEAGPDHFETEIELWTNDDRGTPENLEDDIPAAPIPGTKRFFASTPADRSGYRLLASGFTDIVLSDRVWIVVDTSDDNAGPGLGGFPDIGHSLDLMAIFNHPDAPNAWAPGYFFGGFNPTGCPNGPECQGAGSFRANVWCVGSEPTGACCGRYNGTCTEGVTLANCNGRWVEDGTCAPETFDPPCGTHACCQLLSPNATVCQDTTPENCALQPEGFTSLGKFCADIGECPLPVCMGRDGDCREVHGTPGCENPFCTCEVCEASTTNAFCCQVEWDADCVSEANRLCTTLDLNDTCELAKPITGVGLFDFNNTDAGRDGPAHLACDSVVGNQIEKDVWFLWTATCTNRIFVSTCDQSFVDTKIAVYQGAACPTADESLLVCNDDRCGLQTMLTFDAVNGQKYLIRIGSAPGQGGGAGKFRISCGPPPSTNCPSTGSCCGPTGHGGCSDTSCCRTVCACDSYCCQVDWDGDCATLGFEGSTCGAAVLCVDSCGGGCPPGDVNIVSPPDGVVDARRPFNPLTGTPLLGLTTVQMVAPYDADATCFDLCETATFGGSNGVANVSGMAGVYNVQMTRPLTPGAVTTIQYSNVLGGSTAGAFTAHPGNVNADGVADANDVTTLQVGLTQAGALPYGLLSSDIDHSGVATPLDLLALIDVLNGAEMLTPWNGTNRPTLGGICP